MGKIVSVILIVVVFLTGCMTEGKDYPLAINATVAYEKEAMEKWVDAIGSVSRIQEVRRSGKYFNVPFGKNRITLIEKQGKICKVKLKDYEGRIGYTACEYVITD